MGVGVKVGVMGATGLVGTEMLRVLEERSFPVSVLRAYASPRSRARKLPFAGGEVACDPLAEEWAPIAAATGARVVDNSAAFRGDPDVPLVVAEVNPGDLASLPKGIAACPNCTTMIPVTALAPLHRAARIDRLVVSTYQ